MIQIERKENCSGCTACSEICPQNCIEMKKDDTGFFYPEVDLSKCVQCGLCDKVCPVKNQVHDESAYEDKGYGAYRKDREKGKNSASGGVFPLLAEEIIDQGGVVYGVCYREQTDRIMVCHSSAHTKEEVVRFYNAKYVQSILKGIFSDVESQLEDHKKVLFSGTPCQVAGLKSFLRRKNRDTEYLYCVDNICHGVPSPKAWESYVEYCQNIDSREHGKDTKKLPQFNLRDKCTGWSNYAASVSRTYKDNRYIREKAADDIYMRAFMTSLSLRPSCTSCGFKGYHRESDLTLGDFWGIWKLHKEYDDNQGTSAVLIHSQKGMELWNQIQKKGLLGKCLEVTKEEIAQVNRNLLEPAEENPHRDAFLRQVNGDNFAELVDHYAPGRKRSLLEKGLDVVGKMIKRDRK